MSSIEGLHKIFNPRSIAVIGASERQESVGYAVLNNLLTMGYQGNIFPVNAKRSTVLGVKSHQSVELIDKEIDLAVIATPAFTVPALVKQLAERSIKSIVIISSGFGEIGQEGLKLQEEISNYQKKYNLSIIGPNCLGVMNPWIGMNASFSGKIPYKGKIGFISQSGALCTSVLDWSVQNNIGFSNFISVGSMVDAEFSDLIEYFDQDEKTESIILYIESIKKPEKFLQVSRKFTLHKPMFAIKSGRFEEGSKAAASHTGALAGADHVYQAALERAGIVRVKKISELIDIAQPLSMQKPPKGNRLCIITNAGGPGVLATDALIERGGKLSQLSQVTLDNLNQVLPAFWSHNNPVDVLGDAQADRYEKAIDICLKDQNCDAVLVIFTPQAMSEPVRTARAIARLKEAHPEKPVYTTFMGSEYVEEAVKYLLRNNVPSYPNPEEALDTFVTMHSYFNLNDSLKNLKQLPEEKTKVSLEIKTKHQKVFKKIKTSLEREFLNEIETKELLEDYGIPVTKEQLATTKEQAIKFAKKIGFPVVMKIQSPQILHKSESGGVRINIKNKEAAEKAFQQIIVNVKNYDPDAQIEGIVVQEMIELSEGVELLIGSTRDPLWGNTIVFGAGGTEVELARDTAVDLFPVNNLSRAKSLIKKTRISKLLEGYRGREKTDLDLLAKIILKFAQILEDFPEIKEFDINPLVVKANQFHALDARIII